MQGKYVRNRLHPLADEIKSVSAMGSLQGVQADYDPAAYPSSGNYVSSDGHPDAHRMTSLQSEGSCCGPLSKWLNIGAGR